MSNEVMYNHRREQVAVSGARFTAVDCGQVTFQDWKETGIAAMLGRQNPCETPTCRLSNNS